MLGTDPVRRLAIEDSRNGIVSAKKAGMFCVGLRNGFNDEQDSSGSDIIVKDLLEVDELVSTLQTA